MEKNKILIVTGMHRSGTSVVMQWLNKCGLETGNETGIGASDYRRFEDGDFVDAHKSILSSHRLPETGFTALPLPTISYSERDRLKDIISYKNRFTRQWGWKDPRSCLFLDTYHKLIPDAFYLLVWRDYQSVICSLISHQYKETEKKYEGRRGLSRFIWDHVKKKTYMQSLCKKYCLPYIKIWIAYHQAIVNHLEKLPGDNYIVTEHTTLYKNDQSIFQRLTEAGGFELRFSDFKPLFKEVMLNKSFNIDACIKDPSLISRAKHIENELRRFEMVNNRRPALMAG